MVKYEILKNPSGTWTYFYPTGSYTDDNPEKLFEIMIKHLNQLYHRIQEVEDKYYEYTKQKGDLE